MSAASGSMEWAAGLFEGEGCVMAQHGKPFLQVRMTDEDVVRKFHSAVCGVGKVYGPYQTRQYKAGSVKNNPKWKPNWVWQVRGEEALQLLVFLVPFLGGRRRSKIVEVCNAYL